MITRSIQRTQTPPHLWPLTCDRDLLTRSITLRLSNTMLPCLQIWGSFIFVSTCLYLSGDILSKQRFFFSIWSTCYKTLLKLLSISQVESFIHLVSLAQLVSALTQATVPSLVFQTCEYVSPQIFFFFL